jgi:hypothetical protein
MATVREMLQIQVDDAVGRLAEVTAALRDASINILATCAWVQDGKGHMLLATDDNARACSALTNVVGTCEMTSAVEVLLPNEVGALNRAAARIAEARIQINLCFAATVGNEAAAYLFTSDNVGAASRL